MKNKILLLSVFFASCNNMTIQDRTKYQIEVTYINGDKDTFNVSTYNHPYLSKGDLIAIDTGTLASNVRTYKILSK